METPNFSNPKNPQRSTKVNPKSSRRGPRARPRSHRPNPRPLHRSQRNRRRGRRNGGEGFEDVSTEIKQAVWVGGLVVFPIFSKPLISDDGCIFGCISFQQAYAPDVTSFIACHLATFVACSENLQFSTIQKGWSQWSTEVKNQETVCPTRFFPRKSRVFVVEVALSDFLWCLN